MKQMQKTQINPSEFATSNYLESLKISKSRQKKQVWVMLPCLHLLMHYIRPDSKECEDIRTSSLQCAGNTLTTTIWWCWG